MKTRTKRVFPAVVLPLRGFFLLLILILPAAARGAALLEIGAATAAPGESAITVPISIQADPAEPLVTGMEFTIGYDPAVIGGVTIDTPAPVDFFRFLDQSTYTNAGHVGSAIIWDLFGNGTGVSSGVIANLRFCALTSAALGTHALAFVPSAERRIGGREVIQSVYTAGGETRIPEFGAGSVAITGPPMTGGSCQPDDRGPPDGPPPPPPRPAELRATYELADAAARPGTTVTLPFVISGTAEVSGFSFSVDFDEEVLQGVSIDPIFQRPDGEEYEFKTYTIDNDNNSPGNAGVDEGFLAGAVIFTFDGFHPVVLPRETPNEVLSFSLLVNLLAPPGETEVRFENGARLNPVSPPLDNVATMYFESVTPEDKPSMLLINALLAIIGDASAFVRGDANGDEQVEMSDAVYSLSFLFLGGPPPICFDAGDANDDGQYNIADPVHTLGFLFLGTASPPPPFSEAGADPTPDRMSCLKNGQV